MKKSKLVIGISSRALFDLDESHKIFETDGVDAYREYQILNEEKILNPGNAFGLVKKILEINNLYKSKDRVEVILLSRNSADTGLRVFNSIEAHNLDISRAVFCGGESPHKYVKDFNIDLFLSSSNEDVRMAIESNVASATIISGKSNFKQDSHLLKIAFDGDAVIFSDESEKIYHEKGISAFIKNETKGERISLEPGPMKPFLMELNRLQREFTLDECPIRTALVTARSAPTHKRVIKTLREWGVRIDESLFLGGMSKEDFLKSFQADIFFDDQLKNIQDASGKITSAHVPYGVKNEVK